MKKVIHLLPNAHIDPVWWWDRREGFPEAVNTCRIVVDLMHEFPELTFIRGESSIYRYLEREEPGLFEEIRALAATGRWEVAGGVFIQADQNLPATETLCRNTALGRAFFTSRFGSVSDIGWMPDPFGHAAGIPEIWRASGMTRLAFSRPEDLFLPLPERAFYWTGLSEARIFCYRPASEGYCSGSRDDMTLRLDRALEAAMASQLVNFGFFVGLGDHGGGPTRRELRDIARWREEHPETEVRFSTLGRLFAALEAEEQNGFVFPEYRGELNFRLRGCYSSAFRVKKAYRRAEAMLVRSECAAALNPAEPAPDFEPLYRELCFNTFHDIITGTCSEPVLDAQRDRLGGVFEAASDHEFAVLSLLWRRVDTSRLHPPAGDDDPATVKLAVWNPSPQPFRGQLRCDVTLDFRPLFDYAGRAAEIPLALFDDQGTPRPFQRLDSEVGFMREAPWRQRIAFEAEVPACGWRLYEFGYAPGVAAAEPPLSRKTCRVAAEAGSGRIDIDLDGRTLPLELVTCRDVAGPWGDMSEAEPGTPEILARWRVDACEILEDGPLLTLTSVRCSGGASHLELRFFSRPDCGRLEAEMRLYWQERNARLKLEIPCGMRRARYQVPGGWIDREGEGEVPGNGWVEVAGTAADFGFASDVFYNFSRTGGRFGVTFCRTTRHCANADYVPGPDDRVHYFDVGELSAGFCLTLPGGAAAAARELYASPPAVMPVPAHAGTLPPSGGFLRLPEGVELLSLRMDRDAGIILRIQEFTGRALRAEAEWQGLTLELGRLAPFEIAAYRIEADRAVKLERGNA